MQGWVKIHRQITSNQFWTEKPFSKGQAWIDLILMASYQDSKVVFGNDAVDVPQGSLIISEVKLADRWGWGRNKVRAFLKILQDDNMILKETTPKYTSISIVKYNTYQLQQEEEKGIEEKEEKPKAKKSNTKKKEVPEDLVNKLWGLYPNKKGKALAIKKIPKLIEKYGYEKIEGCVRAYSASVEGKSLQYVQHGSTFFNGGYMDYLEVEPPVSSGKFVEIEDEATGEIKRIWVEGEK